MIGARTARVRWAAHVAALVVVVVVVAACGAGSVSSTTPVTSGRRRVLEVAGSQPSVSARMVCAAEGRREIAATVGLTPARLSVPRWRAHIYECDYIYPGATMTLSVKALSNATETTAYFDGLGRRFGRLHALAGLGQGAFQTPGGATVVRKDYLVLLVDVSGLPARFGIPPGPRADVSLSVAAVIMGCWTGA